MASDQTEEKAAQTNIPALSAQRRKCQTPTCQLSCVQVTVTHYYFTGTKPAHVRRVNFYGT